MSYYFAYGSNVNLDQMQERCPEAELVGTAVLKGHALYFRRNKSGYGVADIQPKNGEQVHGLVWKLTERCEQSLDICEGFPRVYRKVRVPVAGKEIGRRWIMAYVMQEPFRSTPALPHRDYFARIEQGYQDNGLSLRRLYQAEKRVCDEVMDTKQCRFNFRNILDFKAKPKRKNDQER